MSEKHSSSEYIFALLFYFFSLIFTHEFQMYMMLYATEFHTLLEKEKHM